MAELSVVVNAGRHDRVNCPVWVSVEGPGGAVDKGILRDEDGGIVPCQALPGAKPALCFILQRLVRGQKKTLTFQAGDTGARSTVRLKVVQGERVDVRIGGSLFTSYHTAAKWARPFLLPVVGPYGDPITRGYPVAPAMGEKEDHPHHKSCWVAWGDVNGSDNWSEMEGHGRQAHRSFAALESGPVFGRIVAVNDWISQSGAKTLEEERTLVFYNVPRKGRLMDLTVVFKATEGPVRFGDTKEGGICSIRVATSMDGRGQGLIANAYGGTTEAETWGKRAHWCDYVGPVKGRTVGIAIFDTPGNFRYPTYWHVRDYGLMTANPFGVSHFVGNKTADGSHTIEKGTTLTFRYRLFFHAGDTAKARVGERFLDYIAPPTVEAAWR